MLYQYSIDFNNRLGINIIGMLKINKTLNIANLGILVTSINLLEGSTSSERVPRVSKPVPVTSSFIAPRPSASFQEVKKPDVNFFNDMLHNGIFTFSEMDIGTKDMSLCELLNCHIESASPMEVLLSQCNLDSERIKLLSSALAKDANLQTLDLSNNPRIEEAGWQALLTALEKSKSIKNLDLQFPKNSKINFLSWCCVIYPKNSLSLKIYCQKSVVVLLMRYCMT